MSPVIRLSDSTYNRLELYAIGFDAPNNVIERLIDFYESHHKKTQKTNSKLHETVQNSQLVRRISPSVKKYRDIEKENKQKDAVGEYLKRENNWGEFNRKNTVLEFQNSPSKVLCKYSSYSPELERWFWGVGEKYWSKWDDNFYLALLMENEDQSNHSFLLLEPKEALRLFKGCSKSGGEKKINLRLYKNDGLLHLQEWQGYDVKKNVRKITQPTELPPARTTRQSLSGTPITKRPLGRKGYKQFLDYLIPVINLIENGMSHTNAFHQIAKKLKVTYQTVNAQCTKRLGISTKEFVELVRNNKIKSFLEERFSERAIGYYLETSERKEKQEMKMEDGAQLKKVGKLYSKLIEAQFSFMGKGEFHLQKIYSTVKKKHSDLCDDSLMCCECCKSSQDQTPEWQHRVRTVLGVLKNKGHVEKGYNRGYWTFL